MHIDDIGRRRRSFPSFFCELECGSCVRVGPYRERGELDLELVVQVPQLGGHHRQQALGAHQLRQQQLPVNAKERGRRGEGRRGGERAGGRGPDLLGLGANSSSAASLSFFLRRFIRSAQPAKSTTRAGQQQRSLNLVSDEACRLSKVDRPSLRRVSEEGARLDEPSGPTSLEGGMHRAASRVSDAQSDFSSALCFVVSLHQSQGRARNVR